MSESLINPHRPIETFGNSNANLCLYSGFFCIDAPQLGLKGLRYAFGGLSVSRERAVANGHRMALERNTKIPFERMYIDESVSFKWGPSVTQETIEADKAIALKKLPGKMSAMEMCQGEPGRLLHQSLASLLKESTCCRDVNLLLT